MNEFDGIHIDKTSMEYRALVGQSDPLFRPPKHAAAKVPAWKSSLIGAVYFDTTSNKLLVAGAAAWETVTSA